MVEADGIIIGSPVYFADVTPEVKALIDVAGYVTRSNNNLLKRKIGAAVIAVRRGGALHAFETINNFFLINQMFVPGSSYWNFAFGRNPGKVLNDLPMVALSKTHVNLQESFSSQLPVSIQYQYPHPVSGVQNLASRIKKGTWFPKCLFSFFFD